MAPRAGGGAVRRKASREVAAVRRTTSGEVAVGARGRAEARKRAAKRRGGGPPAGAAAKPAKAGRRGGGWGFLFGGRSSKRGLSPPPLPSDWALDVTGSIEGMDGLSLFSPRPQVPARRTLQISPRTHAAIASASLRQGTLGILQATEPEGAYTPEAIERSAHSSGGPKEGAGAGLAGRTEALVNARTEIRAGDGGAAELKAAPRLYASDIGSASFAQGVDGRVPKLSPPRSGSQEEETLSRTCSRRVPGEGTTILVYDDRPPIFIPHMDFSVLPNNRKQYRSSLYAHGIKILPVQSPGRFACLGLGKI